MKKTIAEENAAIEARNKARKEEKKKRRQEKQAREQKAFPDAYGREPEGE